MLKYKTKKIIDCSDWDKLVTDTYKKPYRFQQQDGCQSRGMVNITIPDDNKYEEEEMNNSIPFEINGDEMGVKFEVWLNTSPDDTEKEFNPQFKWKNEMFWDRNFYPHLQSVANDLHERGLIEAGNYVINIDW